MLAEGRLTNVRLEEIGTHAGDVADVVANIVGDDGRVVGVILVDVLLDLADEVRADVRGLGVDAAGDAGEEGDGGGAEAEAGEALHHLGRVREEVRQERVARRRAGEAEADDGKAHDGAGGEGDGEAVVEGALLAGGLVAGARGGGLGVAVGRDDHAPPARRGRERRAGDERRRDRNRRRERVHLGGVVEEAEEGARERQDEDGEERILRRQERDRAVADLLGEHVDLRDANVGARRVRPDLCVEEEDEEEREAGRRERGRGGLKRRDRQQVGHGFLSPRPRGRRCDRGTA